MNADAVEAVLADFRTWLRENLEAKPGPAAAAEPPDLHTLLGQFVALRHEVNLQTKAARAQQEQNAEALKQLGLALEALRQAPAAGTAGQDETVRPLLRVLVDVYDALALARREVQRVRKKVLPALEEMAAAAATDAAPPPAAEAPPRPSLLARWLGQASGPAPNDSSEVRELRSQLKRAGKAAEVVNRTLESVLTGYGMSLQRLDRALQQQGLEVIPTAGERFDPERMEVIEVVADSDHAAGDVVEEVRRGYFWRGRLFRFAQVRVAK